MHGHDHLEVPILANGQVIDTITWTPVPVL